MITPTYALTYFTITLRFFNRKQRGKDIDNYEKSDIFKLEVESRRVNISSSKEANRKA